MIATPEGLENAAAIAAVDGADGEVGADGVDSVDAVDAVDGVYIGPNDLAHNMACQNRRTEEAVQRASEKTWRAVSAAGKCPGIGALSADDEAHHAAWSARDVASVSTGLTRKAFKDAAQGGTASVNM